MALLDFNKTRKKYLTIVLPDKAKTRIQVLTPSKAQLTELSTLLPDASGNVLPSEEDLAALYEFSAGLMSRNKTGAVITKEQLMDCLDFEDLMQFFETYTNFVVEIASSKN